MTYVPDVAQLPDQLRTVFPSLRRIEPVTMLGSGFASTVLETASGIVFRIAKHQVVTKRHAMERRLLPLLQAHLPVTVPQPVWHAGPSTTFPFGVLGYAKVPGVPLLPQWLTVGNQRHLADGLATFLFSLQRFPPQQAVVLVVPGPRERRREMAVLRADVLPPLRTALTPREYGAIARWWERFLADPVLEHYTPVLQHGDLWYENILVDPNTGVVTGIVDWEAAALGDPALDFSTLLHLGEPFVDAVIAAYCALGGTLDPDFAYRMRALWELREFDGVQFAVRFDAAGELADSIRKLRQGPILNDALHE